MARSDRYTPEQQQEAVDLVRNGLPVREVSDRTGISKERIYELIREAGVETVTGDPTKERGRRARMQRLMERRLEIGQRLLEVAERNLELVDSETLVYNFGGRDNTYTEEVLDQAPARERLWLIQGANVLLNAYDKTVETSAGKDEADRSLLHGIAARMGLNDTLDDALEPNNAQHELEEIL